jgi:isoquinoline 1-oxidoreductase alpha subunit
MATGALAIFGDGLFGGNRAMVKLSVNGKPQDVDVPGEMPLLWVLRDEIGLKGTKFGCGISQCGACTVHVDGSAVRACVTPVGSVAGRAIVTVEGLAALDVGPAVQDAWAKADVAQCGYCQAGQMMAAAGLLAEKPKPTDAEILAAMEGNLCRCATYLRIRKAVRMAAGIDTTDAGEG